ncbi:DUF541 domain-containing protein [Candidatus Fermentibacteria bacterium]|nr:DUF541 domain-containing protein [Candidatus Fermentibacteria bacterium]
MKNRKGEIRMNREHGTMALCLLVLPLLLAGCGGNDDQAEQVRQIYVTGYGTSSAEPDLAVIIAGVDVALDDPAEAVDSAATAAEAFMASASELGLQEDDMQTSYYNLWVEEEYDPYTGMYTGETVYRAQHLVRFEVRDLDGVGELLSGLVRSGANSVSSVSFTVEDQSSLKDDAYASAMENARGRAELIADGMGLTLGEIQYVSQYGEAYPAAQASIGYADAMSRSAGASAPPVTAGSFRMSAQVQVTYAID